MRLLIDTQILITAMAAVSVALSATAAVASSTAVTVIVENALAQNKMTPAPKAAKLGIADTPLSQLTALNGATK